MTYPVSATAMQGPQTSLVRGWEKFLPALAYLLCLMLLGSCLTRCAHPICGTCSALPVVGAVTRIMARQSSRSTNKSRLERRDMVALAAVNIPTSYIVQPLRRFAPSNDKL